MKTKNHFSKRRECSYFVLKKICTSLRARVESVKYNKFNELFFNFLILTGQTNSIIIHRMKYFLFFIDFHSVKIKISSFIKVFGNRKVCLMACIIANFIELCYNLIIADNLCQILFSLFPADYLQNIFAGPGKMFFELYIRKEANSNDKRCNNTQNSCRSREKLFSIHIFWVRKFFCIATSYRR